MTIDESTDTASMEISVLIYNVAGHPWPLARGKTSRASEEFIAERSALKGEKSGKMQSSGLLLASNFPIVKLFNHPFNQWE